MGFFGKALNWVKGKGFKEDIEPKKTEIKPIKKKSIKKESKLKIEREKQISNKKVEKVIKNIEKKKETEIKPVLKEKKTKKIIVPEIEKEIETKSELENVNQNKEIQQTEYKKTINNFESMPKVKNYTNLINNKVLNRVQFQPTSDLNQLRPLYEKLITTNGKLDDPEIMNILIENRNKLQHRFNAEFTLKGEKNGVIAKIYVQGVMLEQSHAIYEYFSIGESVNTTTLGEKCSEFTSFMRENYGAIGGSSETKMPKKEDKINDIIVEVDFA